MATARIRLDGIEDALRAIRAMSAQIQRAERRTIRRVTQQAGRDLLRRVAASNNVPQRLLRQRRRVGSDPVKGAVWVGYSPIPVVYLGSPRQTKSGVRVRGKTYKSAFLAQMRSGHRGVFQRVGRSVRKSPKAWGPNLPIQEIRHPLRSAPDDFAAMRRQIDERLPVVFAQELNYQINVRRRR